MNKIRFKPYIGVNYLEQEFKILVLGESHYLHEKDFTAFLNNEKRIENITNNVVKGYIEYKNGKNKFASWMNTFTRFSNVLSSKKLNSKETIEFWEKCSFYNYVQSPTKGPRISPTKSDFFNSQQSFINVLTEIKPTIIVLWGYRLWNNLPKEEFHKKNIVNEKEIYYYHNTPILIVPHPSTSKFNSKLSILISEYFNNISELNINAAGNQVDGSARN